MPIHIRNATPADAGRITTANLALARETETRTLNRGTVLEGVISVMQDDSKGFYLIAEIDARPAGQCLITFEWSDWRNTGFWWIQSVYVTPEHRRKGIYTALHREIVRRARAQQDVGGIRLYVEQGNTRAQQTYRALGMKTTPYLVFEADWSAT